MAISTGDAERLLRFYRDLLAFEIIFDGGWSRGSEMVDRNIGLSHSSGRTVMLHKGNAYLELFQFHSPTPRPNDPQRPVCDHGITHLCLDVTDIEAEYERLRAAGVRFHHPPQDFGGILSAYARDPDGNVVELQEVTAAASAIALPVPP